MSKQRIRSLFYATGFISFTFASAMEIFYLSMLPFWLFRIMLLILFFTNAVLYLERFFKNEIAK